AVTVNSRNKRRVPAESRLIDVAPALAQEPEEDAVAGANHCLLVPLESQSESRHYVVLGSLIQPVGQAVDARESDSATNQQLSDFRRLTLRITRVFRLYLSLERLDEVEIEASHTAVEALLQRGFELIAQAHVQREPRVESPVILYEEAPGR